MNIDEYKANLKQRLREVVIEIDRLYEDADLAPMEKSARIASLESKKCHIRSMQFAADGDHNSELLWTKQKAEWEQRLKVAVAAQAHDLLPKIMRQQEENEEISRRLMTLA